ncbi:MAG: ATP-binding cassette domain-containing protein [Candidatus Acidiferrales bacterium]
MTNLLQLRGLTVQYLSNSGHRQTAVQNVSFGIGLGETLGLMGESGCGKTSVAEAVLGLLPADRTQVTGSVVFRGSDLLTLSERKLQKIRGASISMIYQEPELALNPVMRAGEQIAQVIHAHRRLRWAQCRSEARAMLGRVGFTEIGRIFAAFPHQLSGGQRQRIVLAQALACAPALLIADEPTAHLDVRSQSEILSLFETLKRELRIAILLISHTPEIQARLADRVLVMQAGRIVDQGRFADLDRMSESPYTRSILGSLTTPREPAEWTVEEGVAG